ncbi:thioredoxin family protein [Natrialbaceae archaeon GCM10025810]|uniref:thioredoxin family protein n=1 Tax=Halovalidus salilacus TaxID=3075124 RepID=UPI0036094241
MSELDEERQLIRERKKRQLQRKLENERGGDESDARAEPSPSDPVEIDGADHLQEVIDNYPVVLVDCYADWCGPCRMLEPTIKALAAETDAAVAKVDIDANQRLAAELGARSVPTLLLYADGEPVERLLGVQPRTTLETLIDQYT